MRHGLTLPGAQTCPINRQSAVQLRLCRGSLTKGVEAPAPGLGRHQARLHCLCAQRPAHEVRGLGERPLRLAQQELGLAVRAHGRRMGGLSRDVGRGLHVRRVVV